MRKIFFCIGIFVCILGLYSCVYNTNKEKHFFLEYGQIGYIHLPTIQKNTWETIEIKAPKYEDVK